MAIDKDSILNLECDVLIPASVSGVITEDNAHKLNCKVLAEAANVSAFFTKDAHSSTLLNSVKIFQSSHQYSCQTAQLWKQILATLLRLISRDVHMIALQQCSSDRNDLASAHESLGDAQSNQAQDVQRFNGENTPMKCSVCS